MQGRKAADLADGIYEAGHHTATRNAAGQASGVHLVRFDVVNQRSNPVYTKINKLVLMK
jgi:hypothetical protein